MARTKWLDGLRGIAAAIVAFDHLFMSDIWHPFVSFWADPPDMNRHIVQLPPIRILFSAHAMVTLFMVISGYAISVGLLKDQKTPQFLPRISSAIVRRVFRIYLPVLVTASLAQFLYFFDLFHWNFDENFLAGLPNPWTAPLAHITYVLGFLAETINIVSFRYPGSLNGQLWTMPMEFRGSNIVYLLIIGLSAWRPRSRLYVLPVIAAYFWWYGNWDVFGFIWGLWFAERAAGAALTSNENFDSDFEMEEFEDRAQSLSRFSLSEMLPRLGLLCGAKHGYSRLKSRNCTTISRITIGLLFVAGFYLLCLGNDAHLSLGYQFLSVFQPAKWKGEWDIIHMCWKSIGSVMLIYAIWEFPSLQRPLNTWLVQYLGKISFALYLLHETIYQLWRNPLRDVLYLLLSGKDYGDSGMALVANPFAFHVAWWITGIVLGSLVICAAHYYTIYIDNPCVAFAKKVDRWFSS
jgi:peptidoglycan/LPS O-acetylase OafA/YrhL